MIIKVNFGGGLCDYIYCPDTVDINIKYEFFNWLYNTNEKHPLKKYDEVIGEYNSYRGDAVVYWMNKYILKDSPKKSNVIESFSDKNLKHDIIINL